MNGRWGAAVGKSSTQPASPRLTRPASRVMPPHLFFLPSTCQSSLGRVPLQLRGEGVVGNAQQYSPTTRRSPHKCHWNRQDRQLIRTNHPVTKSCPLAVPWASRTSRSCTSLGGPGLRMLR